MATATDLVDQAEAALALLSPSVVALTAGTLAGQRITRSSYAAAVRVASNEQTAIGSNLTVDLVSVDVDVLHRAAGSTPAQIAAAEAALALLVVEIARPTFWTALAAARNSPLPDVDVSGELERVGEVLRYTVRASCALEA
jgi:hypothetical protein